MCIGDKLQRLIQVLTFGTGKIASEYIAQKLGFESCGCSKRQQYLNNLFGCKKGISLK